MLDFNYSALYTITWAVYLLCAVCFVLGLHFMRSPATARRGNLLSAGGMIVAVVTTFFRFIHTDDVPGWHASAIGGVLLLVGFLIGGVAGVVSARRVKMTAMPQLVSMFNAVGGGAAVFVAFTELVRESDAMGKLGAVSSIPAWLDVMIGSVTFTGSLIAAAKLQGIMPGKPISFPGNRIVMAIMALAAIVGGV
ncbi:MAG: NAD(P)(+) transhydrogenase (Re/Si-specific) subunit beta, partial [Bifidobacteriaceae bacterium]|nr:NAD(P)(+) transhydrogenase (Re/Si-specific) subunit beta [Bifidobacteriaceae bacterium]